MAKYRIYELAKQYNKSNEEVIEILNRHQIEVTKAANSVDESAKEILDKEINGNKSKKPQFRVVRFDSKGRPQDKKAQGNHSTSYSSDGEELAAKANQEKEKAKQEAANSVKTEAQKKTEPAEKAPSEAKPTKDRTERQNTANSQAGERKARDGAGRNNRAEGDRNSRNDRRDGDRGNISKGGERRDGERNISNRRDGDRGNRGERREEGRGGFQRNGERRDGEANRAVRREGDRTASRGNGDRMNAGRNTQTAQPRREKPDESVMPQEGQSAIRRDKTAKKKAGNKKDFDKSRREKEGSSLMAQSLRQNKKKKHGSEKKAPVYPTEVTMPPAVTVKELAELFGREVSEVIMKLMKLGIMATINQNVDPDAALLLADEFGVTVLEAEKPADPTEYIPAPDDPRFLKGRAPVVTIMGHVDHGKTTLLDALRETNVAAHEAGGITQRIGAYQIRYKGEKVTFLDTPGHEAFTAMRTRGAQLTDIAVIIVAADDGVMPQTIEAIHHAKNAGVPILVAINKIDKPGANPDHIKEELSHHDLLCEDWGGDVIMVPISAKKRIGLDELLDNILLVAEMEELKANPKREAYGIVVEAQLDKGRGPIMNVLVQNGTLRPGDGVLAGKSWGRVRAMTNEQGKKLKEAGPSTPVEILGMDSVPEAGDHFYVMDERKAREIAEKRAVKAKEEEQRSFQKVTLDNIFEKIAEGEMKKLDIIIKADVQGSVEALQQSLLGIKSEKVSISVVHSAVGAISESDVMLASASNALIIGFNVRPDANARKLAETEKIDIRLYRVIYDVIDDIKAAMTGLLAPKIKEEIVGHAEVRQLIRTPKVIVAGSYVTDGKITNNSLLRLIRDGIVIHEGKIASLRRFKDDVKEVAEGYECGIAIDSYRDVKEGDQIEAYKLTEEAAELE